MIFAAELLGSYKVIALLGAGGIEEVYRAHDTRPDRTVAIETLHSQFSCDPAHKQRFEREAKAISNLPKRFDDGCISVVRLWDLGQLRVQLSDGPMNARGDPCPPPLLPRERASDKALT